MSQELALEAAPPPVTEPEFPAVPEDVTIDLPFPLFLGARVLRVDGSVSVPVVMCAKIEGNKVARLAALGISEKGNKLLGEGEVPLTAPPDGEDVAQHWLAILTIASQTVLAEIHGGLREKFGKAIIVPGQPVI